MKISVCADIFYYGEDLFQKLDKIKEYSDTIEFWSWHDKDSDRLKKYLNDNGLFVSCFCVDSNNEEKSAFISKCALNSGKKEDFYEALKESVEIAKKISAKSLITTIGDKIEGISMEEQITNTKEVLNYVSDYLCKNDITLLVEPINTSERSDYLLPYIKDVIKLVREVNSPNIKILYDIYHQNMMGDFDLNEMIKNIDIIGHIHIADVPGRNEVGTGKIDYNKVLKALSDSAYSGFIGLEYVAVGDYKESVENIKKNIK